MGNDTTNTDRPLQHSEQQPPKTTVY